MPMQLDFGNQNDTLETKHKTGGGLVLDFGDPDQNVAEKPATSAVPASQPPPVVPDAEAAVIEPTYEQRKNATFSSGVGRGVDTLQATMYGLGAMFTDQVGWQGATDKMMKGYQDNINEAALNRGISFEQAMDDPLENFGAWAAGALGEAVPSLASMVGTGGVGGLVGKYAAKKAVAKHATKYAEEQLIKKGVAPNLAKRAVGKASKNPDKLQQTFRDQAKGFYNQHTKDNAGKIVKAERSAEKLGQKVGAYAGSAGPQIGGQYGDLIESGVDGATAAATAIVTGGLGGALDLFALGKAIDKFSGAADKVGFVNKAKEVMKATMGQAFFEGSTEGLQEVLAITGKWFADPNYDPINNPMNRQQAKSQIIEAVAAGGLVGGVMGGGAKTGGLLTQRTEDDKVTDENKAKAEELDDRKAADYEGASYDHVMHDIPADEQPYTTVSTPRRTVLDQTDELKDAGIDPTVIDDISNSQEINQAQEIVTQAQDTNKISKDDADAINAVLSSIYGGSSTRAKEATDTKVEAEAEENLKKEGVNTYDPAEDYAIVDKVNKQMKKDGSVPDALAVQVDAAMKRLVDNDIPYHRYENIVQRGGKYDPNYISQKDDYALLEKARKKYEKGETISDKLSIDVRSSYERLEMNGYAVDQYNEFFNSTPKKVAPKKVAPKKVAPKKVVEPKKQTDKELEADFKRNEMADSVFTKKGDTTTIDLSKQTIGSSTFETLTGAVVPKEKIGKHTAPVKGSLPDYRNVKGVNTKNVTVIPSVHEQTNKEVSNILTEKGYVQNPKATSGWTYNEEAHNKILAKNINVTREEINDPYVKALAEYEQSLRNDTLTGLTQMSEQTKQLFEKVRNEGAKKNISTPTGEEIFSFADDGTFSFGTDAEKRTTKELKGKSAAAQEQFNAEFVGKQNTYQAANDMTYNQARSQVDKQLTNFVKDSLAKLKDSSKLFAKRKKTSLQNELTEIDKQIRALESGEQVLPVKNKTAVNNKIRVLTRKVRKLEDKENSSINDEQDIIDLNKQIKELKNQNNVTDKPNLVKLKIRKRSVNKELEKIKAVSTKINVDGAELFVGEYKELIGNLIKRKLANNPELRGALLHIATAVKPKGATETTFSYPSEKLFNKIIKTLVDSEGNLKAVNRIASNTRTRSTFAKFTTAHEKIQEQFIRISRNNELSTKQKGQAMQDLLFDAKTRFVEDVTPQQLKELGLKRTEVNQAFRDYILERIANRVQSNKKYVDINKRQELFESFARDFGGQFKGDIDNTIVDYSPNADTNLVVKGINAAIAKEKGLEAEGGTKVEINPMQITSERDIAFTEILVEEGSYENAVSKLKTLREEVAALPEDHKGKHVEYRIAPLSNGIKGAYGDENYFVIQKRDFSGIDAQPNYDVSKEEAYNELFDMQKFVKTKQAKDGTYRRLILNLRTEKGIITVSTSDLIRRFGFQKTGETMTNQYMRAKAETQKIIEAITKLANMGIITDIEGTSFGSIKNLRGKPQEDPVLHGPLFVEANKTKTNEDVQKNTTSYINPYMPLFVNSASDLEGLNYVTYKDVIENQTVRDYQFLTNTVKMLKRFIKYEEDTKAINRAEAVKKYFGGKITPFLAKYFKTVDLFDFDNATKHIKDPQQRKLEIEKRKSLVASIKDKAFKEYDNIVLEFEKNRDYLRGQFAKLEQPGDAPLDLKSALAMVASQDAAKPAGSESNVNNKAVDLYLADSVLKIIENTKSKEQKKLTKELTALRKKVATEPDALKRAELEQQIDTVKNKSTMFDYDSGEQRVTRLISAFHDAVNKMEMEIKEVYGVSPEYANADPFLSQQSSKEDTRDSVITIDKDSKRELEQLIAAQKADQDLDSIGQLKVEERTLDETEQVTTAQQEFDERSEEQKIVLGRKQDKEEIAANKAAVDQLVKSPQFRGRGELANKVGEMVVTALRLVGLKDLKIDVIQEDKLTDWAEGKYKDIYDLSNMSALKEESKLAEERAAKSNAILTKYQNKEISQKEYFEQVEKLDLEYKDVRSEYKLQKLIEEEEVTIDDNITYVKNVLKDKGSRIHYNDTLQEGQLRVPLIVLGNNMKRQSPSKVAVTVLHELGHLVYRTKFTQLPERVQERVRQDIGAMSETKFVEGFADAVSRYYVNKPEINTLEFSSGVKFIDDVVRTLREIWIMARRKFGVNKDFDFVKFSDFVETTLAGNTNTYSGVSPMFMAYNYDAEASKTDHYMEKGPTILTEIVKKATKKYHNSPLEGVVDGTLQLLKKIAMPADSFLRQVRSRNGTIIRSNYEGAVNTDAMKYIADSFSAFAGEKGVKATVPEMQKFILGRLTTHLKGAEKLAGEDIEKITKQLIANQVGKEGTALRAYNDFFRIVRKALIDATGKEKSEFNSMPEGMPFLLRKQWLADNKAKAVRIMGEEEYDQYLYGNHFQWESSEQGTRHNTAIQNDLRMAQPMKKLDATTLDRLERAGARETRLGEVADIFSKAAAERIAFDTKFGAMKVDEKTNKPLFWIPAYHLDETLKAVSKNASKEDYLHTIKLIEGMRGRSFAEITPNHRMVNASLMMYQSFRTLLFATIASLPDLGTIALRVATTPGGFGMANRAILKGAKYGIKHILNRDDPSVQNMNSLANLVGVIEHRYTHSALDMMREVTYNEKINRLNEKFFRYTGLELWTRMTKIMAVETGKEFLAYHASASGNPEFLKELNVTAKQINSVDFDKLVDHSLQLTKNEKAVSLALQRFVHQSVMHPEKYQRPAWGSDARYAIFFQLKSFMYSMHTTVTRRIFHDFKTKKGFDRIAPIAAVAPMYLALAAVGMELREMLKYHMWGVDVPHQAEKEGWDYLWNTVKRSGLLGLYQFGVDAHDSEQQGESFLIALLGPTISQFEDLWGGDWTSPNFLLKQVPGFSQVTGARHGATDFF